MPSTGKVLLLGLGSRVAAGGVSCDGESPLCSLEGTWTTDTGTYTCTQSDSAWSCTNQDGRKHDGTLVGHFLFGNTNEGIVVDGCSAIRYADGGSWTRSSGSRSSVSRSLLSGTSVSCDGEEPVCELTGTWQTDTGTYECVQGKHSWSCLRQDGNRHSGLLIGHFLFGQTNEGLVVDGCNEVRFSDDGSWTRVNDTTVWDKPLYIYYSKANDDVALLGEPPKGIANADSYALLQEGPVAYVSSTSTAAADVPLRAFWSPSRGDIQVTEVTLEELNKHGGSYEVLCDVGHVASDPRRAGGPGRGQQVPLRLSYSYDRADAAAWPLNAADGNALLQGVDGAFQLKQRIGYAKVAACDVCHTTLARAWPSLGGPDCPDQCATGEESGHAAYHLMDATGDSEAFQAFDASMQKAGSVLRSFGDGHFQSGSRLHVSLNYFCCQTSGDLKTMRGVLAETEWPPLNITYRAPVWRSDGSKSMDEYHYSIIVMLDEESNDRMEAWVASLEQKFEEAGVFVHMPRRFQQDFHTTLGVVDGSTFPVEAALAAVSEAVPPGSWTGGAPLTLEKSKGSVVLHEYEPLAGQLQV